jgi:hypothetical protein
MSAKITTIDDDVYDTLVESSKFGKFVDECQFHIGNQYDGEIKENIYLNMMLAISPKFLY